eukprot:GDKI01023946.1.p1 GENE.GDKI01023946.1~~GDKI01023946.1.p1  ORF type:complete len:115 (-),score=26.49 GDKI01023946.1:114-458(-)
MNNRFSLVIGCNDYNEAAYNTKTESFKNLSKAANDADDMHKLLLFAGFHSTLLINATVTQMDQATIDLTKQVKRYIASGAATRDPPVIVVFFSGHGDEEQKSTRFLAVDGRLGG